MDVADLEWLRAVSELGSLSAAAKAKNVSVSTASRRMDALEGLLKVRILDRGARGVRLTPEGHRIAALAQPAIEAAAAVERAAASMRTATTRKIVRISATEFVVADVLAPNVPSFHAAKPGVALELVADTNVVSLAERDADIAIRMSRPVGASLYAQALPAISLGLFGCREFAGEKSGPLPLLTYDDSYGRLPELAWLDGADRAYEIVLRTSSTRALLMAARAGAGIALLPAAFAKREGLVEVAKLPAPLARTPWITVHRDLRQIAHIRAVVSWIKQAFRASL